ncbi:hypothetical protein [Hathewaya limosa]|uniref:Saccharopine dehydrogenase n=1 Tax=Hathewaya limosa TaxID=1536 RepID=A0ABU0JU97_HATLI|nr:hypothetical protein [Hathewaya limosa]MDQ0480676.1 hypothetical protein [Hathewaya limosa]
MKRLIGVLGCGGIIGYSACKELLKGYSVKGGQRKQPDKLLEVPGFLWKKTDLFQLSSLREFCKGCDVVLNCAGPSYKIKEKIANIAIEEGAIYIDVSDVILNDKTIKFKKNGIYILGSGYVPGSSGMIPFLIANDFNHIEKMYCFQGGRQNLSKIAFADLMINSIANSGYANTYIQNAKIIEDNIKSNKQYYIPGMKENVFIKPYISTELLKVCEELKIEELHWYNAVPDKLMVDMIQEAYQSFTQFDINTAILEAQDKLKEISSIFDQKQWSTLVYDVFGSKAGTYIRKRYVIELEDSNTFCGKIAALTVKRTLEAKLSSGVFWAMDIVKNNIPELKQYLLENSIYTELLLPYNSEEILSVEMETDFI